MKKTFGHVGSIVFTLCLALLLGFCFPVFVNAGIYQDPESGFTVYEFHVQGEFMLEADPPRYNFDRVYKFVGEDIDFYSVYSYYIHPDTNERVADYFCIYAFSDTSFTITQINDGGSGNSASRSADKRVVDGKTLYIANFYGYSGDIDRFQFGSYVGAPNMHYHEHDPYISGFDFIQSQLDEIFNDYVNNGGLDWEPDVSKFNDFHLTGVSYEALASGSGLYNVYWTGTTLNDDVYDPSSHGRHHGEEWSNGIVDVFAIVEDMFGREYTAELGSASLQSGKITIPVVGPDFDRSSFDGKIYLRPHVDYLGETYYGAYTIINIKTGLIYDVSSSEGSKTYTWDDFFLSNVKLTKDLIGYYKISWQGTTRSADLIYIPDSDTLVVAAIALEDSQGNIINQEVASTTIGKGYFYFDFEKLLDQDRETAYYWDGMIYLTPTFTKDGDLYMGQLTVVDTLSGGIYQDVIDEDNGIVHREPVGSGGSSSNSFDASSMADYISTGFDFLSDLIRMMQGFPALVAAVFQFIPQVYINAIGVMLIIIFIARVLGR